MLAGHPARSARFRGRQRGGALRRGEDEATRANERADLDRAGFRPGPLAKPGGSARPRPVDQAQWSSGARVENGRPHADLFWREAEGSGDGVKPATLTVSRPAGAGRRARHLFGRVLAVVPPRPAGLT